MNQKTSRMLRKISKIHQKNYHQLKKAWHRWSPEMKVKARIGFNHSIKEWDKGIRMVRELAKKEKEKNETS